MIRLRMLLIFEFVFFLLYGLNLPIISYCEDLSTLEQGDQQNIAAKWAELLATINRLIQISEFKEANAIADKALKLAEQNFGPNSIEVAISLSYIGQANSSMGKIEEGINFYQRAIEIFESAPKNSNTEKIFFGNALSGLANVYVQKKDYKKAEQLLIRSLDIYEEALGQYHPTLAPFLESLAQIYFIQNRFDEAENYFMKVLEINERNYGLNNSNNKTVINNMINLANIFKYQARLDEAESLYKIALKIQIKIYGEEHPDVADTMNRIANVYSDKALYEDAEKFYKRALEINKKTLGPTHSEVALNLNNLAALYRGQAKFDLAESLYKEALEINKKTLGPTNPAVALNLNNLAELYRGQGKYDLAEPLYKEALKIFNTSPDRQDNVAICLNNLGSLYATLTRFDEAESHIKRALEIQEKIFGKENLQVAATLNNLAFIYREKGRFDEAESLHKRSLNIKERSLGKNHLDVAGSLNNLAELYHKLDRYEEAMMLYKRTLEIREKILGSEHPDIALTLSNLAALNINVGNYAGAEKLFKRSLEIREKVLGKEHPDIAVSLNNLASLYFEQKRFDESISFYERALSIAEKVYGKDHPSVALYLSNLGGIYTELKQYNQAVSMFSRAQNIYDRQSNKTHPESINNLLGIAKLFEVQQKYGEAEKIYIRALERSKEVFADGHSSIATALNALGKLHVYQGNFEKAFSYFNQALTILHFSDFDYEDPHSYPYTPFTATLLFHRLYVLKKLSEKTPIHIQEAFNAANITLAFLERFRGKIESQESKLIQWEKESNFFEIALSLMVMMRNNQGTFPEESYLFLEAGFSRNFSEEISQRYLKTEKNIPKQIVDKERSFLEKRKFLQSELLNSNDKNKLTSTKTEYIENEKAFSAFIDSLHQEYPSYAQLNYPRPVALNLVQKELLTPGKVALAYYLGKEQSFVLVITKDKIDLKPLKANGEEIAKEILTLREALLWYEEKEDSCSVSVKPFRQIKKDIEQVSTISQKLYKQLILPVASYLNEQKELVIIPNSSLWFLPFEVLADEKGTLLGRQYRIQYQNSFSVWALSHKFLEEKSDNPKVFVGLGDAIYEKDERYKDPRSDQLAKQAFLKVNEVDKEESTLPPMLVQAIAIRSNEVNNTLKGCSWDPLEASREEIEEIQSLNGFKGASDTRLGFYAGEWNLKDLDQYRYVHFSVHGSMRMQVYERKTQPALVLTQKNPPGAKVDGILTMEEVMNNLKLNADLVVLSACETGVGEVLGGEGVMAMTRAFQYAGSSAVLTSLWKVHEDATKLFMVRFYSYLEQGMQPVEALYLTKKDFQEKRIEYPKRLIDLSHPFFWGAFVLVGGK